MSPRRAAAALFALALTPPPLAADEPPDPAAVARKVDALMESVWKRNGVTPAAPADDAEFHRRAYLDVAGRIPTAGEVRAFLADTSADKRARLVDRLLADPRHHAHSARVWRDVLIPPAGRTPGDRAAFENWLRDRFADNTRSDRLARALVTADPRAVNRATGAPAPEAAYMQSLGPDAGNIAASAARVFLGLPLECARCHNHPFAKWTRDQFWQLAAVFEDVEPAAFRVAWRPRIRIPDTDRVVLATLPDGTAVNEKPGTPRDQFAAWLARPDNPFFARAGVDRAWAALLGGRLTGEDCDDAPPPHAAALDELSRAFVRSGFDLRFLARTITATRAYQLSSALSHPSQADPRLFARMAVKPLSAEQLADALTVALGGDLPEVRAAVLDRFAGSDGEATILQALWWMNGPVAVRAGSSRTLRDVADDAKLGARGAVETLFLATLSRPPSKAEADRLAKYVESGGPRNDRSRALADVFWVLLNSTEFAANR